MDIVITYVNGLDTFWQKQYQENAGAPLWVERFRDWGTLKYIFRGIEVHMPFIKNVFLVVSSKSQVPSWLNTDNVKIVLHSDFIPQEFLPTFNCNTIESFMPFIPELGEEFIYFNDDCFPIGDCKATDFFVDGKPMGKHYSYLPSENDDMFRKLSIKTDRLAQKLCGVKIKEYVRPQHTVTPMLKSKCIEAFTKGENDIKSSITVIRNSNNINQYLYNDYLYYKNETLEKPIIYKYFSFNKEGPWKICEYLKNPERNIICINDGKMNQQTFKNYKRKLLRTFDYILPEKSKFEI